VRAARLLDPHRERRHPPLGGGAEEHVVMHDRGTVGIKYRYDLKVENILWECGYPHADTPFPKSQMSAKEVFEGVPRHEVDLITHKNAEKLFKFPPSQRLIDAHSAPST
jgi:hypothetical protein